MEDGSQPGAERTFRIMGEAGQNLVFPTVEEIVDINRYHIATTGGFHNGGDN